MEKYQKSSNYDNQLCIEITFFIARNNGDQSPPPPPPPLHFLTAGLLKLDTFQIKFIYQILLS